MLVRLPATARTSRAEAIARVAAIGVLFIVGVCIGAGFGALRRSVAASSARAFSVSRSEDSASCARSLRESDGFYCVSDAEWDARVEGVRRSAERGCDIHRQCCAHDAVTREFECFNPVWNCLEERIGKLGDGGKWICDVDRMRALANQSGRTCLIYSFGSNGDYSFEQSAKERMPECEIFTFDPTVDQDKHPAPEFVRFFLWGIGSRDNVSAGDKEELGRRAVPGGMVFRMQTIMRMLGHAGRAVDIAKIDVDGSEYRVFDDLARDAFFPFRQIQLETHSPRRNIQLHEQLRRAGYVVFHKECNYWGSKQHHEWGLLKLTPTFFADVVLTPQLARRLERERAHEATTAAPDG